VNIHHIGSKKEVLQIIFVQSEREIQMVFYPLPGKDFHPGR
jgi:hypothetical protein